MADNVPVTAGSGTNMATDDVSGVHYQRVKLTDGAADSSTPIVTTTSVEGTGDNTPVTGVIATGVGPGWDRRDNPTNLATATSSTSTFDVNGCDQVVLTLGTSTSGGFILEGTYDGTNYVSTVPVYEPVSGNWQSGLSVSPTSGRSYTIATTGFRQVRVRVTSTLGATMSHFWTGSLGGGILQTSILSGAVGSVDGQASQGLLDPDGTNNGAPVNTAGWAYNGSSWDRVKTTQGVRGTADNSPATGVLAVGIGPGWDHRDDPSNLGTATNSASTFDVNGSGMVRVGIGTTTTGTFTIEATADNTNWVACEVYDSAADLRVTGAALTPTSGKVYIVTTGGYRQIRLRTTATLGATMAHFFTGSVSEAMQEVKTIPYLGPIPGISSVSFTASTTQTSVNVVAGTAGQRIYVTSLTIGTGGTTAGRVSLYWGTGAFTNGTSPTLADVEFAPSATVRPGLTQTYPYPMGGNQATGDNLRITTSAGITVYVTVGYYKA